jgi:Cupin-like domain
MLNLNPEAHRQLFDREPFGFTHDLSRLPIFGFDYLFGLAQRYAQFPRDFYVAESAKSPDAQFYAGAPVSLLPHEALQQLSTSPTRILLKRLETHDAQFEELLKQLFEEVVRLRGGLSGERLVRLESSIFVTSAASTTPCHYDPEINFFAQLEGEKTYHLFPPDTVTEEEMEAFYVSGEVSIAEVDLNRRDPSREHVFRLRPGMGLHQPQNAPHWVETGPMRSISYSFVFETDATRARGRVRAYNRYLRRLGMSPTAPGLRPGLDQFKQRAIRVVRPLHRGVRSALNRTRAKFE